MAEPWVSVQQAALHLGVSTDSIYRWIQRRGLPARRIGRLWKFRVSDIDVWVQTAPPTDEASSSAPPVLEAP